MPHVSAEKLDVKVYGKLFKQLAVLITAATAHTSHQILNELLTDTERIMLSKRLAAVVMFSEGYSQYIVEKTLKISPSTAARLHHAYEHGAYAVVVKLLKQESKSREQLWQTVEVLLRLGMPSMGKDRWKHLDRR